MEADLSRLKHKQVVATCSPRSRIHGQHQPAEVLDLVQVLLTNISSSLKSTVLAARACLSEHEQREVAERPATIMAPACHFPAFATSDDLLAVFAVLFALLLGSCFITLDIVRGSIRVTELLLRLDVVSQPLL